MQENILKPLHPSAINHTCFFMFKIAEKKGDMIRAKLMEHKSGTFGHVVHNYKLKENKKRKFQKFVFLRLRTDVQDMVWLLKPA